MMRFNIVKYSMLHTYVNQNDYDKVLELLENGANVNEIDENGNKPLFYTFNQEQFNTYKDLMNDLYYMDDGMYMTYSFQYEEDMRNIDKTVIEKLEIAKLLIEYGADLDYCIFEDLDILQKKSISQPDIDRYDRYYETKVKTLREIAGAEAYLNMKHNLSYKNIPHAMRKYVIPERKYYKAMYK